MADDLNACGTMLLEITEDDFDLDKAIREIRKPTIK